MAFSFSDITGGLKDIFGTDKNTDTTGSSTTNEFQNSADVTGTETASSTSLDQLIKSLTSSATSSLTSGNSTGISRSSSTSTQNVDQTTASDPAYIALQKTLVDTSTAHAKNAKTETQDLVSSILNKAALTFAPTLSSGNTTGVYNSTSLGLLQGNAMAQAAADSASAVLGYQTTEEGLAQAGAGNLLNASKRTTGSTTTNTSGEQVSNTSEQQRTDSSTNSATASQTQSQTSQLIDNIIAKLSSSSGFQQTDSKQSQSSLGGGLSVICTVMFKQGNLTPAEYRTNINHFMKQNKRGVAGYYMWAIPVARFMVRKPDSWQSRAVKKLFLSRGKYVAGSRKLGPTISHHAVVTLSAACYITFWVWKQLSFSKIAGVADHG